MGGIHGSLWMGKLAARYKDWWSREVGAASKHGKYPVGNLGKLGVAM